jgi:hypothetical protein
VSVFTSAFEDVAAWAEHLGGSVEFLRVAVTPEQVDTYGLPTAPPKPTDRRKLEGQTCQAEALDPAVLAVILTEAIEAQLDLDVYQAVLDVEEAERNQLIEEFNVEEDPDIDGTT